MKLTRLPGKLIETRNGKGLRKTLPVGSVVGSLTVIDNTLRNKYYCSVVLCKCACGETLTVGVSVLMSGRKLPACPKCSQRKAGVKRTYLPKGESGLHTLIRRYRGHAKENNREWLLDKNAVRTVTQSFCFYCGDAPKQIITNPRGKENGAYLYNGLDRLDNSLGYTPDNAVSCCKDCNFAKRELSLADFLSLIRKVYERHCL